jgi:hypothetical protein
VRGDEVDAAKYVAEWNRPQRSPRAVSEGETVPARDKSVHGEAAMKPARDELDDKRWQLSPYCLPIAPPWGRSWASGIMRSPPA